ncbi:unnamed protein product [Didymodactylos carnosus]|uniref:Uncharacterized protein n=1 Tax=Didymodactylos carnosus TaxID=1234261 RepID=A0A814XGK4_9BILA|nr:unnamed protein product [Didymodactylos carnosus]CAF3978649.1 unnamed protein product [Didymodactylos carnosus]
MTLISLILIILATATSHAANWAGKWDIDSGCDTGICCCFYRQVIISAEGLFQTHLEGHNCPPTPNNASDYSSVYQFKVQMENTTFQQVIFDYTVVEFVLDTQDTIRTQNLNNSKCDVNYTRNDVAKPNWIGLWDVKPGCNEDECCCFVNQASVSSNPHGLTIDTDVRGAPCQEQLNASHVKFDIPSQPEFVNELIILGSWNRFAQSVDQNTIYQKNLQYPRCSAGAIRVTPATNASTAEPGTTAKHSSSLSIYETNTAVFAISLVLSKFF